MAAKAGAYVVGDGEPGGRVPAGLVQDENGMSAGHDCGADLPEVNLHHLGVGKRHYEGRALTELWADSAEDPGPFRSLIMRRARASARSCPTAGDQVLLPYTGFILKPDLDASAASMSYADLRDGDREVF